MLHSVVLLHGLHMSCCNLVGVDMHFISWPAMHSTASLSCPAIVLFLLAIVLPLCCCFVLQLLFAVTLHGVSVGYCCVAVVLSVTCCLVLAFPVIILPLSCIVLLLSFCYLVVAC